MKFYRLWFRTPPKISGYNDSSTTVWLTNCRSALSTKFPGSKHRSTTASAKVGPTGSLSCVCTRIGCVNWYMISTSWGRRSRAAYGSRFKNVTWAGRVHCSNFNPCSAEICVVRRSHFMFVFFGSIRPLSLAFACSFCFARACLQWRSFFMKRRSFLSIFVNFVVIFLNALHAFSFRTLTFRPIWVPCCFQ